MVRLGNGYMFCLDCFVCLWERVKDSPELTLVQEGVSPKVAKDVVDVLRKDESKKKRELAKTMEQYLPKFIEGVREELKEWNAKDEGDGR